MEKTINETATKSAVKEYFESFRAKYWEKDEKQRVYFKDFAIFELAGYQAEYKYGKIISATFNGQPCDTKDAQKFMDELYMCNVYFDLNTGKAYPAKNIEMGCDSKAMAVIVEKYNEFIATTDTAIEASNKISEDPAIISQLEKLESFAEWTSQEDWDAEDAINAISEYNHEHSDLEESDGDTIEYSNIFELLVTWKQHLGFDKALSLDDIREILESGLPTDTNKYGEEAEPFTELPYLTNAVGEKLLGRISESQFQKMSYYQSEMARWFIGNGNLTLEEARNYKITDEDILQIADISDFKEYFTTNYYCAELGDLHKEYIHELLSGVLADDIERAEQELNEIED